MTKPKNEDYSIIIIKSNKDLILQSSRSGIFKNLCWLIISLVVLIPFVIFSIAYDIRQSGNIAEVSIYSISISCFLIGISVLINLVRPYKISLKLDEKRIYVQKTYLFRKSSQTFSIFEFGEIIVQTNNSFFLIIKLKESIALAFSFKKEQELKRIATELKQFIKRHKKK